MERHLVQTTKKILKFLRAAVIALLVLYGLGMALLTLPSVQRYASMAVSKELSRMLDTRVNIGHLTVGYPNRLILDDVEIDDSCGQTLLRTARLSAKFDWIPLLRDGRVSIHTAQIFGLHAHISRPAPEAPLNIQFLLDALASEDTTSDSSLDLRINSLLVRRCRVTYDVLSEASTPGVFNPHHLSVDNINATVSLKALSTDSINAQVKRLDLTEQSGFHLEGLQMHLLANVQTFSLEQFDMRLPKSRLQFDAIRLHTAGAENGDSLSAPFLIEGKTADDSYLTPADIAPFLPVFRHFHDALHFSASVYGNAERLELPSVNLYTKNNLLALHVKKAALYLPDDTLKSAPRINADVDRLNVAPRGIPYLWTNLMGTEEPLPEPLGNLAYVNFKGKVEGRLDNIHTRGHLDTGIGAVSADARLHTLPDSLLAYEGHIESDSLDMKTLLGEEQKLGILSFNLDFKGRQAPGAPADVYLKGAIPTLEYSGYGYRQIQLDGRLHDESFDGLVVLEDPNVDLLVDGHFGLRAGIPTFDLTARLDRLRPYDLKLTDDREGCEYAAILKAHFNGNNPANLAGTLSVDSLMATLPRDTFFMPRLTILSEETEGGQRLMTIESEAIEARIEGTYDYETLPTSFVQIMQRYLPSLFDNRKHSAPVADNEFTFDISLKDSKLYPYVLGIPLKVYPKATLKGFISNKQERMEINGDVPNLTYNDEEYQIGTLRCHNSPSDMVADFCIAKQMAGDTWVTLTVDTRAADDHLNTTFSWGNDSPITYAGNIEADTYFGRTDSESDAPLQAEVKIKPSEIIINDTVWNVAASTVRLDSGFVDIQRLGMSHGDQRLTIDGRLTDRPTDSLVIDLNRISTEYILDIVQFRSVDFSGKATGKVYVNGALGDVQARTDLRVDDFHFNHGLMGDMNVSARWDKEIGVVLTADIREADTLAQTLVNGYVSPQQKGLDLHIDTRNTNLAFLNSFIGGIFADVSGRATGPIRLHGTFKNLNLEGKAVATAGLTPRVLNTPFRIENDSVILTADAISFPDATAYDPDGNAINLSGKLTHRHLKNMGYDFNLELERACFYHTTDFGDMPFYGKIYGTGNAHLRGGGNVLRLDGNVRTERGTTFFYDMSAPEALTDNHFVTFVDRTPRPKQIVVDNLRLFQRTREEEEDDGEPLQVYINANIDATPNAEMHVVMDRRSDDGIADAHGSGSIRVNYTNERTTLGGDYTFEDGKYHMSIQNLIHKEFDLQRGSKVEFTGNGGEANIDLKAIHQVNSVSLSDLVPDATFNQNSVRVDCVVNMTGKLDNPDVDFDLELPTINDEERQMVRSAISTEEQTNTQILYLLSIGKFYTYDYAATEGRESSDAMSSLLSSTLSGQLNNILSQALNMRNWNFSSNLSTGQEGWSDLGVEGILSGRLLNNRLLINGNFGYRENEMRNSNFVGDFNVQVLLTPSGNFAFKIYNMTNDRYFAKQTFNTQGAGFVFKREFDNWRYFFRRKK